MRFFRLFASAFVLVGFAWCLSVLSIYLFARRDEARRVDAIVVLGAAQYDGHPSPVLEARLDHARDLFDQGIAGHVILTGGVGVGDTISEAEVGRQYFLHHGVDPRRILIEGSGLSTSESMRAVARLADSHDLDTVVLVSDPFHMLRLRLIAAKLGLRAYSSPTRSSPIYRGSVEEWRHVVRESFILPSLLLGRHIPELATSLSTALHTI